MAKILFEIRLPVKIKKKANVYVSSCDALDIHTQGYSEKEARQNLVEAVKLFLVSCFERGTLDEVLKECGFRTVRGLIRPMRSDKFITVPIPFDTKGTRLSTCRA